MRIRIHTIFLWFLLSILTVSLRWAGFSTNVTLALFGIQAVVFIAFMFVQSEYRKEDMMMTFLEFKKEKEE